MIGHQQAEHAEGNHHRAIGQRQQLAEELAAGGQQAHRGGQASQGDDHCQQYAAGGTKGVLHVVGKDLHAVLRLAGNALAGGAEIKQCEIDQRQPHGGNHPGADRIAGDQRFVADPAITDGGGNHNAEHQGTEGVHGQVALQKALHQRCALVGRGRRANSPRGHQQRRAAEHQQGTQQHRGDPLADAVHQLAGVEREEQHRGEIHQGIQAQRQITAAAEGRHAHLEGHHGSARRGKQRTDGQVHGNSKQPAGLDAQGRGQAWQTAADPRQGNHGQQRQADTGEQKARRRQPHLLTSREADTGGEDDVAGTQKQGKGHKPKGQQVGTGQALHEVTTAEKSAEVSHGDAGGNARRSSCPAGAASLL